MNNAAIGSPLQRIFLEALVLCVFAAVVGISLNYQLIFNAFSGKTVAVPTVAVVAVPDVASDNAAPIAPLPFPVELDELESLLAAGAVLVDARSASAYRQEHLSGAVSLPFAEVESKLDNFKQQVDLKRTLIAYCSGYGCPDSFDLGVVLLQAGYAEVLVYEGGVPEWRAAGLPLVGGD
ncbi:MAG: hypothetical protein KAU22_05140 [Desulfuromonadales bacterium]|nr:hypothetical protein [Desulfuromonadales bacterium]